MLFISPSNVHYTLCLLSTDTTRVSKEQYVTYYNANCSKDFFLFSYAR